MSLRLRLLAAFAYVLLLVIVALEVALAINLSRRVDAEVKAQAAGQAQLLAARVSGRRGDRAELQRMVASAGRELGGRVIVVDRGGRLLADSEGPGLAGAAYGTRPEIARALAGRTAQGTRRSASLGEELLCTTVPILERGRSAGAVRVTQSVDAVRAEVRRTVLALVGVGVLALLAGLAVAWMLAGSLSRPLRGLARAARRMGEGDLGARAEVTGSREQRELAEAFNETASRLGSVLAAQRDFVANASHSLRTPLTGLRLRLEAAALKARDPDVERELTAGERELDRLAKLLSGLLTLAREDGAPPRGARAPLSEAARAAAERWRPTAERAGQRLELEGDGDPEVAGSREDLAIVLDNLLENALEHSPIGASVTIEWGRDGAEGYLAVSDRGPGLDETDSQRVFERFYRGSSSRGRPSGTGLGLAIVDALARRFGGTTSIVNRPQGGARAELRLPLAPAAEPHPLAGQQSRDELGAPR